MRCDCCDKKLTDYECSIKSLYSGDYLNTCVKCLKDLGINYKGNNSLRYKKPEDGEDFEEEYKPVNLGKGKWDEAEEDE